MQDPHNHLQKTSAKKFHAGDHWKYLDFASFLFLKQNTSAPDVHSPLKIILFIHFTGLLLWLEVSLL